MISNEMFNYEVSVGSQKVQNQPLWYSEDTRNFLTAVYNKDIPMFSAAYSHLAYAFEQLYKGVCAELQKLYPDNEVIPVPKLDARGKVMFPHDAAPYAKAINRYIPLGGNREAYFAAIDNLERIQSGYTGSKYNAVYNYDDFKKDYERYDRMRTRLLNGLEMEINKNNLKDIDLDEPDIE